MQIKDVENFAELARIDLSEDEKQKILADMESILVYVKQIEEAEVLDISVRYSPINVWREDEIAPPFSSRDLIIGQFPDSQDGFLKVKKIM